MTSGYLDREGNKLTPGDRIKDDENFIWEVVYRDGQLLILCEDLLAEEKVYPRARLCKKIM